jgi:glutamate carboxypeptidase
MEITKMKRMLKQVIFSVGLGAQLLASTDCAVAADLTKIEQNVVSYIDQRREAAIDLLARTVNIPSATKNHEGVKRLGDLYATEMQALGFETRWVDQSEFGRAGHFIAERRGTVGKRLLLIAHLDTVFQDEMYRREGQKAYGSGISDTKGGNVIAIEALRALHASGALEDRQVIVIFTGDEEVSGKPYEKSRAVLIDAAKRSDIALAFEGYSTGTAVTGRRGYSMWRLDVTGSQGHSSTIFGEARGSGAIFEASRILSAFHEELREPYLTFNPGVILGGTDVNFDAQTISGTVSGRTTVVPRSLVVLGDMRFLSGEQLERARAKMRTIVAKSLPKTSATISFTDGMPPMAPTEGNLALLSTLDGVSRDLGTGPITAHDPSKRGAADVSFVSTLVSALDGLGALGGNEHALGEWVNLEEQPALTKRVALLMYRLMWVK